MNNFIDILKTSKIEQNENTIKVLRKILSYELETGADAIQLYLRIWDVLDYMTGKKTLNYNFKIENKYKNIEEE